MIEVGDQNKGKIFSLDIMHRLHDIDLAHQLLGHPLKGSHMASAPAEDEMTPVASVIDPVKH